jgi:hypothetical protein
VFFALDHQIGLLHGEALVLFDTFFVQGRTVLANRLLRSGLTRVIHFIREILKILLHSEAEQLTFFKIIVAHMLLVLREDMLTLLGTGNSETTVRVILLRLEELPGSHGNLRAFVVGIALVEILTIKDLI